MNVTKAWTQTPAAENDGDLWPVVENALARAYGGPVTEGDDNVGALCWGENGAA
jgi:hypothetical protein